MYLSEENAKITISTKSHTHTTKYAYWALIPSTFYYQYGFVPAGTLNSQQAGLETLSVDKGTLLIVLATIEINHFRGTGVGWRSDFHTVVLADGKLLVVPNIRFEAQYTQYPQGIR